MRQKERIRARAAAWFPSFVSIDERYVRIIRERLRPRDAVLHLGAGRDLLRVVERTGATDVVSLDLDADGLRDNANPRRVLADAGALPFAPAAFDLILCENVFEHLERPGEVLREVARVLRPGGRLAFMCPNRLGYIALAARLTPLRVHVWFRGLTLEDAEENTFPTLYRLNSRRRIRRLAADAGLEVERIESMVGAPSYWEVSDLLHRIGVLVHWALERGPRALHIALFGVLRKPSA
jgi:SAM-dependent methyltransferase